MLRVALVGCGKIADAHASQIQRIENCEIVGVCDRELLMARQLYERYPVGRYFSAVTELLSETRPDVVHITTPPGSHFHVAKQCLESGCHVYVEKPFTLDASSAESLVALAEEKNLKLTVGHDAQFSHVSRRMRSLVETGYLGGDPVHMESYYSYDLGDVSYARAFLGDERHWLRSLPGGLMQNVISHGIARIAEFLTEESPHVIAHGFVSPFLRALGEESIVDELRVIISQGERTTAYFTVSTQMRPSLHQFRLYGPRNGLLLDQSQELLIKLRGTRLKSYAEQFVPPINLARQHMAGMFKNLETFLRRDFHPQSGMKCLIESFYRSIVQGTAVPISYREILLTARIMDAIFRQVGSKTESVAPSRPFPSEDGSVTMGVRNKR